MPKATYSQADAKPDHTRHSEFASSKAQDASHSGKGEQRDRQSIEAPGGGQVSAQQGRHCSCAAAARTEQAQVAS